jgi:uncharacterized Fe-S cluster protein YjdI
MTTLCAHSGRWIANASAYSKDMPWTPCDSKAVSDTSSMLTDCP